MKVKHFAIAYGILMAILMIPVMLIGFLCQILWRYFETGLSLAEHFEEWVSDKINKENV